MNKTIQINDTQIGEQQPVYIIAELSANHEQNLDLAIATIKAMKEAGADAVKVQTFTPDSITLDADQQWFRTREDSLWAGRRLYDLYQEAYTPWEWHAQLKKLVEDLGMDFFSSPFAKSDVDKLETLEVPAYKIASFEISDIPLISYVAQKGKPVIMSTGIAKESDIQLAVETCRKAGNDQLALLKCTSSYPTPMDQVNLATIPTIAQKFETIAGLSDHTLGIEVPLGAVALGAKIIEKHFVLDRNGNGLDKDFSLTPDEFKNMVDSVRKIELAIGSAEITLTEKQEKARVSGRSLFAIQDIEEGDIFTEENVKSLRPALGLHPKYLPDILGKKALVAIERGAPLEEKHFL